MEPIIQVNDVTFLYNSDTPNPVPALFDVNLTISPGDYVVIVGHNGSGKSTLAKHFNALLQPTKGDVLIRGLNTRELANLLERGYSRIAQWLALGPLRNPAPREE